LKPTFSHVEQPMQICKPKVPPKRGRPLKNPPPVPVEISTTPEPVVPIASRVLEAKTLKAKLFKLLFESLKFALTEANLVFDATGLRIVSVDSRRTALIHLFVPSTSFESFYCPDKRVLGVDILNLHRMIKSVSDRDILCLFVDRESENELGITIINDEKQSCIRYAMQLKNLANQQSVIERIQYEVPPPEISSIEFQSHLRAMKSNGSEYVDIVLCGDELKFRARGGASKHEVSYKIAGCEAEENPELVQGTFSLKFLVDFAKSTHLCPTVRLCLKNNAPLILEYYISAIHGTLRYVLTPSRPT
jgi:proliferating cell nuclear antigen